MILECVVARSIVCSRILVSASSWVLNNSGRSLTPVCSTTFTNWQHKPLVFLEDLWSRICQVYTYELCHADLFVAFFINFRLFGTLRRPLMTYVGVVSLPVRRSRSSSLIDISQSYRSKTRVTVETITYSLKQFDQR